MNWQEICDDPTLRDLPFKIETGRWGHIVMSPASNRHSLLQAEIQNLLRSHCNDGYAFPECSIQTAKGVKVADVAWGSDAFFRRNSTANPYPEAPEIVVEVASPSNSIAELLEKKELYFARSAQEVWLCTEDGRMLFFGIQSALVCSALVAHHVGGAAAEFVASERNRMRNHLLVRNSSILAHGERPINQEDWDAFSGWIEQALLQLLEREAKSAGFRRRPAQLPDRAIW